jgi:hypothetical protein
MSSGWVALDNTPGALMMITFLRVGPMPRMLLRKMMNINDIGSRKYASCFKVLDGLELLNVEPGRGKKGRSVNNLSLTPKGIAVFDWIQELEKILQ